MRKPTYRRVRRKIEPASSTKEESREQCFFGPEHRTAFFTPAADDVQRAVESPEEEEPVQRQAEEERENEETAVQTSPDEEQEGL